MQTKNKYLREEYHSRINRVIDYIEENLNKSLSLEELAGVANFSRYHFHRIFRAMVGETLNQFIGRVRVERAATRLLEQPKKSITEVALDCGFSGSASFARAFNNYYKMSASEWRNGGCEEFSKNRKMVSKDGKTLGKDGKEPDGIVGYFGSVSNDVVQFNRSEEMQKQSQISGKVEVKDLEEMHVAYVRHIGPYQGNDQLFGELFGKIFRWAGPRGLVRMPETKAITIYHDNPEITDDDKLRISVGITVPNGTPVDGEVGMTSVPAGRYAMARFELDPDQYGDAWNWTCGTWLPDSGYQPDERPTFELYYNDPKEHPEGKHIVDICVPVKPL